jgi:hypothetical protein
LHGVTSQKIILFIVTAMRTSDLPLIPVLLSSLSVFRSLRGPVLHKFCSHVESRDVGRVWKHDAERHLLGDVGGVAYPGADIGACVPEPDVGVDEEA